MGSHIPEATPKYSETDTIVGEASTWGSGSYKAFDGHIFSFQSSCPYTFCRHCVESGGDFDVELRRSPGGAIEKTRVTIDGNDISILGDLVVVNGERVQLPYTNKLIHIRTLGEYKVLSSRRGTLTLMWDRNSKLSLTLHKQYETCGLCGSFGSAPGNISEHLAASRIPGDCPEAVARTHEVCADGVQHCDKMIRDYFEQCGKVGPLARDYQAVCVDEYCRAQGRASACATFSELSRLCAADGPGAFEAWREDPEVFCEKPLCPEGHVYRECVPANPATCSNVAPFQDSECVSGCTCPEGYLLDDVGDKGGCVLKAECPCEAGGKVYQTGDVREGPCGSQCTCQEAKWSCTEARCPGRCKVEGSSLTTFDGVKYSHPGNCHFLAIHDEDWSVTVELRPCPSGQSGTCLTSVALLLNSSVSVDKYVFNNDGTVTNDNIRNQSYYYSDKLQIFRVSSSYLQVETHFHVKMQIQTVPVMQLYLSMPPGRFTDTVGLCGSYNNRAEDDFMSSQNILEKMSQAFADSWEMMPCQRASPASCISIEKERFAERHCGILLDTRGPFASCHLVVNPKPYHEECKRFTCTCERGRDCLCALLGNYVKACAERGTLLAGWRDGRCEHSCPSGLVFKYNVKACNSSCRSLSERDRSCDVEDVPVDGCTCPTGTFQNSEGRCVPKSQCDCYLDGQVLQPGRLIHLDDNKCVCRDGLLLCQTPIDLMLQNCSGGAEYVDCRDPKAQRRVDSTCSTRNIPTFDENLPCKRGCYCPVGMVRDSRGKCVLPDDCPCSFGGREYEQGSVTAVGCNKCTCVKGSWNCTQHECQSTCHIYGEGHVRTFDGRSYSFDGLCQYSFLEDYCGGENGTFRMLTESVPCCEDGLTCSRKIVVAFQDQNVVLHDGKVTAVRTAESKECELRANAYSVHTVGLYLIVKFKSGMTVIWDKNTRVSVILDPHWHGRVCGLCGNNNGDLKDDFTTRHSSVAAGALEFGNSWKTSQECADTVAQVFPCDSNPYCKAWAVRKCEIIRDSTFRDCHSKVDPSAYYDACIEEACACDMEGKYQGFCTSVAMYAEACSAVGVCVTWRRPDLCPVYCDYYNSPGECSWHYAPCGTVTAKTCKDHVIGQKFSALLEGCYAQCPDAAPYLDENTMKCVTLSECSCFYNDVIPAGGVVQDDCGRTCYCIAGELECSGECVPYPVVSTELAHTSPACGSHPGAGSAPMLPGPLESPAEGGAGETDRDRVRLINLKMTSGVLWNLTFLSLELMSVLFSQKQQHPLMESQRQALFAERIQDNRAICGRLRHHEVTVKRTGDHGLTRWGVWHDGRFGCRDPHHPDTRWKSRRNGCIWRGVQQHPRPRWRIGSPPALGHSTCRPWVIILRRKRDNRVLGSWVGHHCTSYHRFWYCRNLGQWFGNDWLFSQRIQDDRAICGRLRHHEVTVKRTGDHGLTRWGVWHDGRFGCRKRDNGVLGSWVGHYWNWWRRVWNCWILSQWSGNDWLFSERVQDDWAICGRLRHHEVTVKRTGDHGLTRWGVWHDGRFGCRDPHYPDTRWKSRRNGSIWRGVRQHPKPQWHIGSPPALGHSTCRPWVIILRRKRDNRVLGSWVGHHCTRYRRFWYCWNLGQWFGNDWLFSQRIQDDRAICGRLRHHEVTVKRTGDHGLTRWGVWHDGRFGCRKGDNGVLGSCVGHHWTRCRKFWNCWILSQWSGNDWLFSERVQDDWAICGRLRHHEVTVKRTGDHGLTRWGVWHDGRFGCRLPTGITAQVGREPRLIAERQLDIRPENRRQVATPLFAERIQDDRAICGRLRHHEVTVKRTGDHGLTRWGFWHDGRFGCRFWYCWNLGQWSGNDWLFSQRIQDDRAICGRLRHHEVTVKRTGDHRLTRWGIWHDGRFWCRKGDYRVLGSWFGHHWTQCRRVWNCWILSQWSGNDWHFSSRIQDVWAFCGRLRHHEVTVKSITAQVGREPRLIAERQLDIRPENRRQVATPHPRPRWRIGSPPALGHSTCRPWVIILRRKRDNRVLGSWVGHHCTRYRRFWYCRNLGQWFGNDWLFSQRIQDDRAICGRLRHHEVTVKRTGDHGLTRWGVWHDGRFGCRCWGHWVVPKPPRTTESSPRESATSGHSSRETGKTTHRHHGAGGTGATADSRETTGHSSRESSTSGHSGEGSGTTGPSGVGSRTTRTHGGSPGATGASGVESGNTQGPGGASGAPRPSGTAPGAHGSSPSSEESGTTGSSGPGSATTGPGAKGLELLDPLPMVRERLALLQRVQDDWAICGRLRHHEVTVKRTGDHGLTRWGVWHDGRFGCRVPHHPDTRWKSRRNGCIWRGVRQHPRPRWRIGSPPALGHSTCRPWVIILRRKRDNRVLGSWVGHHCTRYRRFWYCWNLGQWSGNDWLFSQRIQDDGAICGRLRHHEVSVKRTGDHRLTRLGVWHDGRFGCRLPTGITAQVGREPRLIAERQLDIRPENRRQVATPKAGQQGPRVLGRPPLDLVPKGLELLDPLPMVRERLALLRAIQDDWAICGRLRHHEVTVKRTGDHGLTRWGVWHDGRFGCRFWYCWNLGQWSGNDWLFSQRIQDDGAIWGRLRHHEVTVKRTGDHGLTRWGVWHHGRFWCRFWKCWNLAQWSGNDWLFSQRIQDDGAICGRLRHHEVTVKRTGDHRLTRWGGPAPPGHTVEVQAQQVHPAWSPATPKAPVAHREPPGPRAQHLAPMGHHHPLKKGGQQGPRVLVRPPLDPVPKGLELLDPLPMVRERLALLLGIQDDWAICGRLRHHEVTVKRRRPQAHPLGGLARRALRVQVLGPLGRPPNRHGQLSRHRGSRPQADIPLVRPARLPTGITAQVGREPQLIAERQLDIRPENRRQVATPRIQDDRAICGRLRHHEVTVKRTRDHRLTRWGSGTTGASGAGITAQVGREPRLIAERQLDIRPENRRQVATPFWNCWILSQWSGNDWLFSERVQDDWAICGRLRHHEVSVKRTGDHRLTRWGVWHDGRFGCRKRDNRVLGSWVGHHCTRYRRFWYCRNLGQWFGNDWLFSQRIQDDRAICGRLRHHEVTVKRTGDHGLTRWGSGTTGASGAGAGATGSSPKPPRTTESSPRESATSGHSSRETGKTTHRHHGAGGTGATADSRETTGHSSRESSTSGHSGEGSGTTGPSGVGSRTTRTHGGSPGATGASGVESGNTEGPGGASGAPRPSGTAPGAHGSSPSSEESGTTGSSGPGSATTGTGGEGSGTAGSSPNGPGTTGSSLSGSRTTGPSAGGSGTTRSPSKGQETTGSPAGGSGTTGASGAGAGATGSSPKPPRTTESSPRESATSGHSSRETGKTTHRHHGAGGTGATADSRETTGHSSRESSTSGHSGEGSGTTGPSGVGSRTTRTHGGSPGATGPSGVESGSTQSPGGSSGAPRPSGTAPAAHGSSPSSEERGTTGSSGPGSATTGPSAEGSGTAGSSPSGLGMTGSFPRGSRTSGQSAGDSGTTRSPSKVQETTGSPAGGSGTTGSSGAGAGATGSSPKPPRTTESSPRESATSGHSSRETGKTTHRHHGAGGTGATADSRETTGHSSRESSTSGHSGEVSGTTGPSGVGTRTTRTHGGSPGATGASGVESGNTQGPVAASGAPRPSGTAPGAHGSSSSEESGTTGSSGPASATTGPGAEGSGTAGSSPNGPGTTGSSPSGSRTTGPSAGGSGTTRSPSKGPETTGSPAGGSGTTGASGAGSGATGSSPKPPRTTESSPSESATSGHSSRETGKTTHRHHGAGGTGATADSRETTGHSSRESSSSGHSGEGSGTTGPSGVGTRTTRTHGGSPGATGASGVESGSTQGPGGASGAPWPSGTAPGAPGSSPSSEESRTTGHSVSGSATTAPGAEGSGTAGSSPNGPETTGSSPSGSWASGPSAAPSDSSIDFSNVITTSSWSSIGELENMVTLSAVTTEAPNGEASVAGQRTASFTTPVMSGSESGVPPDLIVEPSRQPEVTETPGEATENQGHTTGCPTPLPPPPVCHGPLGEEKSPGDTWTVSCHRCTCSKARSVACRPLECLPLPTCGPGERLVTFKANETCCEIGHCEPRTCLFNNVDYEVGASFEDPSNPCVSYACQDTGLSARVQTCPKQMWCAEEDRVYDSNKCCYTCKPSCRAAPVNVTVQFGGCRRRVEMALCKGDCRRTPRYNYDMFQLENSCHCCQAEAYELRDIALDCPDGSTKAYTYRHVTGCSCRDPCQAALAQQALAPPALASGRSR
ncbi:uncharacterized protein LOC119247122 [Talpa occidentalis]|uniref:uncharacterized protein LOC119247122 n=1 Tax=Talpa occidentalis TaxID=50954 RepID=UPI001890027C|nr:uncharacterized protein LOC119247122 [Talpa occidentalis]